MTINAGRKTQRVIPYLKTFLCLFLVIALLFCACGEWEKIDLTNEANLTNDLIASDNSVILQIQKVEIKHATVGIKKRYEVSHENLHIDLDILIKNNSTLPFKLWTDHPEFGIHATMEKTYSADTLLFKKWFTPDSIYIQPKELLNLSISNELYYFEGLFEKKDDYTHDMVKLLKSLKFTYKDEVLEIPILYAKDVKVYGVSRMRAYW